MLQNVLSSITTTAKATTVTDNSATSSSTQAKAAQEAALDAIKTAASSFASTLDLSNPEASVSAPGIEGKSKYVETTDLGVNDKITTSIDSVDSATTSTARLLTTEANVTTEISMNSTVFAGKKSATVSALQLSADSLSNVEGGNKVISKNLELSLINPANGSKYNISGLTGTCPIQFIISAKTSASGKIAKCKYYDPVSSKFTDTGCTTTNTTLGNNNYKIVCCCNHLTTFAVAEED